MITVRLDRVTGKLRNSCSPLRSAEVCGSLVVIAGADTHKAGHQMESATTVMQPVASFGVVSGRDVDLILAMPTAACLDDSINSFDARS